MNSVELSAESVEPPSWLPDLNAVVSRVAAETGYDGWSVSVLLCTNARIQELNRQFRDVDEATDVLSFSQTEGETCPTAADNLLSGDVVVAPQIVEANAAEYGVDVRQEGLRVLIHALLHLAGHTHDGVSMGDEDAASHPMFRLQENLLLSLEKESMV
jgi:probable rRNA maturation factor